MENNLSISEFKAYAAIFFADAKIGMDNNIIFSKEFFGTYEKPLSEFEGKEEIERIRGIIKSSKQKCYDDFLKVKEEIINKIDNGVEFELHYEPLNNTFYKMFFGLMNEVYFCEIEYTEKGSNIICLEKVKYKRKNK